MIEIREDIRKLQSVLKNLVRVGVVSSINSGDCTAKVAFKEFNGGVVSYDLPIMVKQSMHNKDYWMPDIHEQVVCVFLPTGLEQGFILGSFYSDVDKTAVQNPDVRQVTFSDGTVIQYDREAHKLTANCVGNIEVQCQNATITASNKITATATEIEATGNVTINGNLTVNGKIEATSSISDEVGTMAAMRNIYNQHGHPDNGAGIPTIPME